MADEAPHPPPTQPLWVYLVDDQAEPVSAEQLDAVVAALLLAMVEADAAACPGCPEKEVANE